MRVIKYYDRISKQYIDLEVTDEVARFLFANDKWLQRKQKEYGYYTISLDTVIFSGESEDITLQETIAAPEEEIMNCKTCMKRLKFYNLIWKIVGNLEKEKYDLIWDTYVERKSQKKIATELGISESAISQLKTTAINDLIYHFNYDEEFKQTSYYKKYYKKEVKDFARIASELTAEEIGRYIMNSVYDFSKVLTQTLKKSTMLHKDIESKNKISKANRIVKQAIEVLNPDNAPNKQFNIPKEINTTENINNILEQLSKFFK